MAKKILLLLHITQEEKMHKNPALNTTIMIFEKAFSIQDPTQFQLPFVSTLYQQWQKYPLTVQ